MAGAEIAGSQSEKNSVRFVSVRCLAQTRFM